MTDRRLVAAGVLAAFALGVLVALAADRDRPGPPPVAALPTEAWPTVAPTRTPRPTVAPTPTCCLRVWVAPTPVPRRTPAPYRPGPTPTPGPPAIPTPGDWSGAAEIGGAP